jgi:hypothetical protein
MKEKVCLFHEPLLGPHSTGNYIFSIRLVISVDNVAGGQLALIFGGFNCWLPTTQVPI